MPVQYTEIFEVVKMNISMEIGKNDIFHIFSQHIQCGYTLEPPRRDGSNDRTALA